MATGRKVTINKNAEHQHTPRRRQDDNPPVSSQLSSAGSRIARRPRKTDQALREHTVVHQDKPSQNTSFTSEIPVRNVKSHSDNIEEEAVVASHATVAPLIDSLDLSRGVQSLLGRLANVINGNSDLQRRLELQHQEVKLLQEAGLDQQKVIRDFEQQVDQSRRAETLAIEARVRAKSAAGEAQLRSELENCRAQLEHGHADLREHCNRADGERRALEAELGLVRDQLTREIEARHNAERTIVEARKNQQELQNEVERSKREFRDELERSKHELERSKREASRLQHALDEQQELARFRGEQLEDMEARYKRHRSKAKKLLRQEQEKLEIVSRLDGMLPKSMLMKAVA